MLPTRKPAASGVTSAARCGNTNARIDTILARFRQPLPLYLSDVSPRVHDLMTPSVVSVSENATCAEALELIDRHEVRILPVTGLDGGLIGTVSIAHLGSVFTPRVSEPRLMRQVNTSLANIVRALRARAVHLAEENVVEELYVRLGTMDIRTFWTISERENIPARQSLIIVGDRRDIQRRAIELGIRGLIITSNLDVDAETVALAKAKGVSLIISPYDSANQRLGRPHRLDDRTRDRAQIQHRLRRRAYYRHPEEFRLRVHPCASGRNR